MSRAEEELLAWLRLWRAPGIGSATFRRLLDLASPAELLAGPPAELPPELREALRRSDPGAAEADLRWREAPGRHILTLHDPAYPALLKEIPDPPPLLFVQGDPGWLSAPQLAVVGSRNPTAGGIQTARDFAACLARTGLLITSGLALGIDSAAHRGALQAGGATLAVTGTGPDRVYPARNRELAHSIAGQGALVTEFPPGTGPRPENFPRRNRIISGLSLGTLVVEAAPRSGSLITARLATEQGREVFAIPGSIHNPLARGCHALLRQGAKLVETAADILEELGPLAGTLQASATAAETAPQRDAGLSDDQQALLESLGYDPVSVDQLVERSGLTAEAVSSMLLILELDGYVSALSGGRYVRTEKRG
ncbi:DNA-processing protein DprA [Thiohalobacter sp. IOR34]|uniref:DNA-processing protein DprA n=1 Tax=Thiohalobacter sp. IOR34 TaxID=3057176 RepID=UPI0025B04EEA|nr:DNA-processing protein DprA [Thiohalobacter sp. IOR34]WJW75619.1 DNA-processing protein DprA [Thiohalobacter sp. IOR34]